MVDIDKKGNLSYLSIADKNSAPIHNARTEVSEDFVCSEIKRLLGLQEDSMTGLESKIWAATFANAFLMEYKEARNFSDDPIASVDGYSCAELAECAVEKFRELANNENREYLTILAEE